MQDRTVYRFGDFIFEAGRGLYSGGRRIHLPPKVASLLLELLKADGAPLDRDGLARLLASRAKNVDAAVARAIYLLRRALGDTSQGVIQTEYGRGVRLAVPVATAAVSRPLTSATFSSVSGVFPQDATGEEMIRTAFEIASSRSERNLRLAGSVLAYAFERYPTLALAPSLHADVEVSRMIRGHVRASAHSEFVFGLVDKALTAMPGLPSALATKGWLLGVLKEDLEGGLALIDGAITASPKSWLARFYRSWLLVGQRKLEPAAAALEEALAISPLERATLAMKGWLLCARGMVEEARAYASQIIALRPDIDLLWIVQAIALTEAGHFLEAEKSIAAALAISPDDIQLRADEAWLLAASGQREAALDYLNRRAKSPDYVSPVKLAMVRHALSDTLVARNLLRTARADKDPWRLLAWCDPRLRTL